MIPCLFGILHGHISASSALRGECGALFLYGSTSAYLVVGTMYEPFEAALTLSGMATLTHVIPEAIPVRFK